MEISAKCHRFRNVDVEEEDEEYNGEEEEEDNGEEDDEEEDEEEEMDEEDDETDSVVSNVKKEATKSEAMIAGRIKSPTALMGVAYHDMGRKKTPPTDESAGSRKPLNKAPTNKGAAIAAGAG